MGAHPESLLARLQTIPDPRRWEGRMYPLRERLLTRMLNPGYPPGAHRPYPAQVVEYLDDPYDDDYYDERPRPRRRANVIEGDAEEV